MKTKKLRDLVISSFLIVSLACTVVIVSCSEEDGGIMIGRNNTPNYPYPSGVDPAAIGSLFSSIAGGATSGVSSSLTGWALSAMGVAGNSNSQLTKIQNQLQGISSSLQDIDNELGAIEATLGLISMEIYQESCGDQNISLQGYFGTLTTLYQNYNNLMSPAFKTPPEPISQIDLLNWVNSVNTADVLDLLNTIDINLSSSTGALVECIKAMPTMEGTGKAATGSDTIYYNNVSAYLNQAYYWQTVGLFMYSEAEHYTAWVAAGSPDTISSDSVQIICSDSTNANISTPCNAVWSETNNLYNKLLGQYATAGAPYTNDYLLLYYDSVSSVGNVFVKSLEDFTSQAGYNCPTPLTQGDPCGPTMGWYNSTLSVNEYRGTTGFQFANSSQLNIMLGPANNDNVNYALDVRGYQYVTPPQITEPSQFKTVIASNTVDITLDYTSTNIPSVPFFMTGCVQTTTFNGLFYSKDDFSQIFPSHSASKPMCNPLIPLYGEVYHFETSYSLCGGNNEYDYYNFLKGYAQSQYCNGDFTNFYFTESNYTTKSASGQPGWVAATQNTNKGQNVGQLFLWPVVNTADVTCTTSNSWHSTNAGGFPTICGDDFKAFINTNIPIPATCDNIPSTSITPCNVLD